MPTYSFNPNPVLQLLQGWIVSAFQQFGEEVGSIPLATTAAQIAASDETFPLTAIEVKSTPFVEVNEAVWTWACTLTVVIHHVRELNPSGNAILDANDRMANLAASIAANPHLETVAGVDFPYIEEACPGAMICGEENPLQMEFARAQQNSALAVVSLIASIRWIEPSQP